MQPALMQQLLPSLEINQVQVDAAAAPEATNCVDSQEMALHQILGQETQQLRGQRVTCSS